MLKEGERGAPVIPRALRLELSPSRKNLLVFRKQSPFPELNGKIGINIFNWEVGNALICALETRRGIVIISGKFPQNAPTFFMASNNGN